MNNKVNFWGLIHRDGTLRATFRTRKLGLRARCTDGHTTKCCTVIALQSSILTWIEMVMPGSVVPMGGETR